MGNFCKGSAFLIAALFCAGQASAFECEQEISIDCPAGYVDGCNAFDYHGESPVVTHHVCLRPNVLFGPRQPCEDEKAADCFFDEADACTLGVARAHICVLPVL